MVLYWFPVSLSPPLTLPDPLTKSSCARTNPQRTTLTTACFSSFRGRRGRRRFTWRGGGRRGVRRRRGSLAVRGHDAGRRSHSVPPAAGPHRLVHSSGRHHHVAPDRERDGSLRPRDRLQHGVRGAPRAPPGRPEQPEPQLAPGRLLRQEPPAARHQTRTSSATRRLLPTSARPATTAHGTGQNQNPVIAHMLFQGNELDGGFLGDSSFTERTGPPRGVVIRLSCSASQSSNCPTVTFDVDVPPSSQERPPRSSNGQPLRSRSGSTTTPRRARSRTTARPPCTTPTVGKVTPTAVKFQAPTNPTTQARSGPSSTTAPAAASRGTSCRSR